MLLFSNADRFQVVKLMETTLFYKWPVACMRLTGGFSRNFHVAHFSVCSAAMGLGPARSVSRGAHGMWPRHSFVARMTNRIQMALPAFQKIVASRSVSGSSVL